MKISNKILASVFLWGAIFNGCVKKPSVPALPGAPGQPTPEPSLSRTFGEVRVGTARSLWIHYKDMQILVNPAGDQKQLDSNFIDYVLLTSKLDLEGLTPFKSRLNIKILCPEETRSHLSNQGFSNAKTMPHEQKILLKKGEGFLFMTSYDSEPQVSLLKNILLEFDNGRNVFIGHVSSNQENIREMVYSLRDDGKELYTAFFYTEGKSQSSSSVIVEAVEMLQPVGAFVVPDVAGKVYPL